MVEAKEKKISFLDLVKSIHPDFNPEIQNPGEKMDTAIKYKNDEERLYVFAVHWGIIEDDEINETIDKTFKLYPGKQLKINQKHDAIIVDCEWKDSTYEVIVHVNGSFRKFLRKNEDDQDQDFYVVDNADDKAFIDLDFKYQQAFKGPQEIFNANRIALGKVVKINQKADTLVVDVIEKDNNVDVVIWDGQQFRKVTRKNIDDQNDDFKVVGSANDNIFLQHYNNYVQNVKNS